MAREFNVAVAGATGAVGTQMVQCLEERNFPVKMLRPLASERSFGKAVTFRGKEVPVQVLDEKSFEGIEIALFSAGGSISLKLRTHCCGFRSSGRRQLQRFSDGAGYSFGSSRSKPSGYCPL